VRCITSKAFLESTEEYLRVKSHAPNKNILATLIGRHCAALLASLLQFWRWHWYSIAPEDGAT
jgi:hypothetical protein